MLPAEQLTFHRGMALGQDLVKRFTDEIDDRINTRYTVKYSWLTVEDIKYVLMGRQLPPELPIKATPGTLR